MKLFFNLSIFFTFLTINLKAEARNIILIEHYQQKEKYDQLVKIINKKIGIPIKLIQVLEKKPPCTIDLESIMHICIDSEQQVKILHLQKETLKKSFSVFLNQEIQNENFN